VSNDLYHFVTHWHLKGTTEEVYELLSDTEHATDWWPSLYHHIDIVGHGQPDGTGKVVNVQTKGFLPYLLQWSFRVTDVHPFTGFRLEAWGELEGTGTWTFEQQGDTVAVTYDWNVRTVKPLLRALSFLRPFFAWNHSYVMKKGEEGIRRELQTVDAPPPVISSVSTSDL